MKSLDWKSHALQISTTPYMYNSFVLFVWILKNLPTKLDAHRNLMLKTSFYVLSRLSSTKLINFLNAFAIQLYTSDLQGA